MVIEPVFGTWSDAADRLTPLATLYRYPGVGQEPDREESDEALDDARSIVDQVLVLLPVEVHPEPPESE